MTPSRPTLKRTALAVTSALIAALLPLAASHAQDSGTLAKIQQAGAITLGYRESSFGFSYLDGDLKPVGYSMDICRRIVDEVKAQLKLPALQVRYQAVTSANRIPLVANGTVDLECGSTTNLVERQKQVAFSPDIFRYNVRMLVRADSGLRSVADLQGKTVATTAGTTSFRLLREADRGRNLDITNLSGKDHSDSFMLVESGRAQAFVLDDILLAGQIANAKNPQDYLITGESLRTENQALMLRKDDAGFKAIVDRVVTGMMQSGEMEKLYNRWFMSPIPPRNININYPLNAETREAFAHPSSKGI
ncbi:MULTISPECIES: amino acid ABC transporter substrate-binding protein [Delftia]|jgi:glutamate/aspartate transport system substrate-binding protein|uniref:amino acid ABC transporter substrate-binding protein n=1 Tax=Delftia TaxID=80865 RepID=UPI00020E82BA|nr:MULTISPECIES: amino acid ABC transporter substrate-binding protein [Delftia]AEF90945.1 ABC-type transporter, periplasmic subunit family 3 [Delftia sp. Cs1-4]MBO0990261.1 amino acid ABC transporter substrate-binding protein [Delftia sp. SD083]MBO1034788.1 amino acid ABC transporter substrate-binding protein [Delftia sp. SD018]OWG19421.1 amino acid ABC transporter substrate-binding protein [Delftia sp. K82]WAT83600.1 amino acid ABC transporter substrate-binding protein [Delftia acidovorans]